MLHKEVSQEDTQVSPLIQQVIDYFGGGERCVRGIYEGHVIEKMYMGAPSVGLREMVMTMNRLASKVNRKMDKKTMKSIFRKCGFCVSPKRTNSVTLLGV